MDKKTMIDNLNEDLAGEFAAIMQYITYAAKATGPYRPQLSTFFLAEVADEQAHAQFLANKIVALGGQPTSQAREVPRLAPCSHSSRHPSQCVGPPTIIVRHRVRCSDGSRFWVVAACITAALSQMTTSPARQR